MFGLLGAAGPYRGQSWASSSLDLFSSNSGLQALFNCSSFMCFLPALSLVYFSSPSQACLGMIVQGPQDRIRVPVSARGGPEFLMEQDGVGPGSRPSRGCPGDPAILVSSVCTTQPLSSRLPPWR